MLKKLAIISIIILICCIITGISVFYDIDCKWILLIIGTLSNPYISGIIYTLGLIFIVFYFQVEISKKRIKKDFR
jgi:uncharacterized membrane protein